jgi:hypothetical protein
MTPGDFTPDERRWMRAAWRETYTAHALVALHRAAICEPDFAGWLATILTNIAAGMGSADALVAGRPGSWEAADVRHLVEGTAGPDLAAWRPG